MLIQSTINGEERERPVAPGDKADWQIIHETALVVDTHNDTMGKVIDDKTMLPIHDIGKPTDFQLDIAKAKAGGLKAAFYAAFTEYQGEGADRIPKTNSKALALINGMYFTARNNPRDIQMAGDVPGIMAAVKSGRQALIPAVEGGYFLEERNAIELLRQYWDLGVRYLTLVWNPENSLGAGTTGPNEMGLTSLGQAVIREMNRLGMMVDVSHMNEQTFWDTVECSRAPVMASHSNAAALVSHVRNITDEQITAIARSGGVVNVNFWAAIVAPPGETPTIAKLVDHIDHIRDVAGIDHIGLGSDFDGADMMDELKDAVCLPLITKELFARGYSRDDLHKILGLNTLRVMAEVQALAENPPGIDQRGMAITTELAMGESLPGTEPILIARVIYPPDAPNMAAGLQAAVILDGLVYPAEFDPRSGEISFPLPSDVLRENFHVVTFQVRDEAGRTGRQTVIFYLPGRDSP